MFVFFELANIISATIQNKNLLVGLFGGVAAFIQLFAYGMGFLKEGFRYLTGR